MPTDHPDSYFELFGLSESFDLDLARLDQIYRELQRNVHPDRFANASDHERRLSVQQAAKVNDAYRILKDPMSRGRYLLELHGFQFNDEHVTTRSTEFLMEQMELREALADVRNSDDPQKALDEVMESISRRLREFLENLKSSLHQDTAGQLAGSMEEAADTIMKMKFYRRLQEEVLDLETELHEGPG
jgi:molecular chaperone HscB